MTPRRLAREEALRRIFQDEFQETPETFPSEPENPLAPEVAMYAQEITEGVRKNRDIIDEQIHGASRNWKIQRMGLVDRNILRIAVYEMAYARRPVPPKSVINEAIELAKCYGSTESASFVNGILDQIHQDSVKN